MTHKCTDGKHERIWLEMGSERGLMLAMQLLEFVVAGRLRWALANVKILPIQSNGPSVMQGTEKWGGVGG